MSTLFDKSVLRYKKKFDETVERVSKKSIVAVANSYGVSQESLKTGFIENTENFRKFVYKFSSTLMPGRVSCTTYAAVCAVIAKELGIAYEAKCGFCLPKDLPRYDEEVKIYNEKKATDNHPIFPTHVYIIANGKEYEYYNGETSGIDHIDVVTI